MKQDQLLEKYVKQIQPILPLAKKAYGSRALVSPEHNASRKYTKLLVEYYNKGGSLVAMANALGVAYPGVRRRVITADLPPAPVRKRSAFSDDQVKAAVERIRKAKEKSAEDYHTAVAKEYEAGVSLAKIAEGLGISSSQPLYYAVSRHAIRKQDGND